MLVKKAMTKKAVSLKAEDNLSYAIKKLVKNKISGAPVIDKEKRVIGMVTESDILRAIDVSVPKIRFDTDNIFALVLTAIKSRCEFEDIRREIMKAGKLLVKDAMTKKPICIEPEKSVIEAVRLMNKYEINRLPVTKANRLVGIIARADIIKALGCK